MKKKNIGGRRRPPTGDDQRRSEGATVIGCLCAPVAETQFLRFWVTSLSPVRQDIVALIQTEFLGDNGVARAMNCCRPDERPVEMDCFDLADQNEFALSDFNDEVNEV
ncbi:hypothetical protein WN943_003676 [Citrus x changshan-huyou]